MQWFELFWIGPWKSSSNVPRRHLGGPQPNVASLRREAWSEHGDHVSDLHCRSAFNGDGQARVCRLPSKRCHCPDPSVDLGEDLDALKLSDAREPIRAALQRLAESPRELRCFVIIRNPLTGRFIQYGTPPPPSRFGGSERLDCGDKPIFYDGTGNGKPGGFAEEMNKCCTVERGVEIAINILSLYLSADAEIRITEESTHVSRPS